MICPVCGGADLISDVRDLPFTYKGETTMINQVEGDYCPSCNDVVLKMDEVQRVMELKGAFIKEVNASFVEPDFIVSVRKKLKLDQKEAGAIFGGGANAFSRYENGKNKPSLALVKLLKVLDKHPELFDEVRAA